MTYKDCIRNKPWLRVCNINNICVRMLEATKGNAFVVFNRIQQNYELHTVEAQRLSGDSYNATLPLEVLNNFLIMDYKATNFEQHLDEILSEKTKEETFRANWGAKKREADVNEELKHITNVLGTKI